MNVRNWCAALGILACTGATAIAQSEFRPSPNIKQYTPRLVTIMSAAQNQHLKLWFAGKAKNWELAAYELRQLTDSLAEAAMLYPGIPVSNVTTMQEPLLSIADAVMAGNSRTFAASMHKLTDGCNACHGSMDRSYVVMTLPTEPPPPANQVFAPPGTDRKK
jgi:hypothetical protein